MLALQGEQEAGTREGPRSRVSVTVDARLGLTMT